MPAFEIHPLDLRLLGLSHAVAAFLVIGPEGPVLVETGPGSTLPTLQSELARFGLTPADIRDVLVTHIHLDHAGAAGWWTRRGARVHVHHVGLPHLVEPSKLLASARRIYGAQVDRLWGECLPAVPELLRALHDVDVIEAGGLRFLALETPGHARHHLVYKLGEVAFTGDVAAIRLPFQRHVRVPGPPPEFDLDQWLASLRRLRALTLERLYLTHFGVVDDVDAHWAVVEALLSQAVERVFEARAQGLERDAIREELARWEYARQAADGLGCPALEVYDTVSPIGMTADGLMRYWSRREAGKSE